MKLLSNTCFTSRYGGVAVCLKLTKRCLSKDIGQAKLFYDEVLTAITKIKSIINYQTPSYVALDNLEEPLLHHTRS